MILTISLPLIYPTGVHAQETELPFFQNGSYMDNVPSPVEVLGFSIGEKPANYHDVIKYLKALEESSPYIRFYYAGETHEKRKLCYVIISSEENLARIDDIRSDISKLADPRKVGSGDAMKKLIEKTPAVVWMLYSIHGNELSGTEASLQLAYQLAAGNDPVTKKIRNELIVGIYPMENPDGRERYLAQMQQWSGKVPNTDGQSVQHRGIWPYGRTNHYLFDLNRDWFILAHPESRARVKLLLDWNPQLVVDAHEMWYSDTYLFSPPREPINPNIDKSIHKWANIYAADQAKAFDKYGWSYYTREWLEEWYPGYGSAWPYYIGSVSILYEQANTSGSPVKQPNSKILTFRESVHHQFISSMANIVTASENRKSILSDYYDIKKSAIASQKKTDIQAYYIDPGKNPTRAEVLIERLIMQGIDVSIAKEDFQVKGVRDYWSPKVSTVTLPKGTYIISMSQPNSSLVNAIMEFDPRMTTKFLQSERESLEKGKGTRMYEVSAWSFPMAYNLKAYTSTVKPTVKSTEIGSITHSVAKVVNPKPAYGFVIDYSDDKAIEVLLKFYEKGYKVRSSKKPFKIEGRSYSRGSLLLRLDENSNLDLNEIIKISQLTNTNIIGVNTALSQSGPDLGGREFQLLTSPKIALLSGPSINMNNFGAIWYLLDYELNCPYSILDHNNFSQQDLRKYNVIVLPSSRRAVKNLNKVFTKSDIKKLKAWIKNGGTLIGIGNSAAFLADTSNKISKVRIRRQALKNLDVYKKAVERELSIGDIKIDSVSFWEGESLSGTDIKENNKEKVNIKELAEQDKQLRIFMPRGAILRVNLNEEHWLSFGAGSKVPAIVYTSYAFLSKPPVQTPARFSEASQLRLSGLLWPEARKRWEKSAYLTREAYGNGQIILFAGDPNFRSYFYGTARLLINSMLLGPGFGTKQGVEW